MQPFVIAAYEMNAIRYSIISRNPVSLVFVFVVLLLLMIIGLFAAHRMESVGHIVTGMNNRVVWGIPHVFAVFMIVAASGALNMASVVSVFGQSAYKPLARLSTVLALALLIGGLLVLVLDLGRPERLVVAMTHYNYRSIFAWNIFLYTGFVLVLLIYAWLQMERRFEHYSSFAGKLAFLWRLVLTSGTGLIFGILVARPAFDTAIMAPMFILMSLSFGSAIFILLWCVLHYFNQQKLDRPLLKRLVRLQGIFIAAVLYIVIIHHTSNLYVSDHRAVELFLLRDGGHITILFWLGQMVLGTVVPLLLVFLPAGEHQFIPRYLLSAVLVVLGGLAQLYVIIIGGQSFPMPLFPGLEVVGSSLHGDIIQYSASWLEFALALGGLATVFLLVLVAVKVLPLMPVR